MIDKSRTKAPKGTLPEFTPVPRLCNRHDGWTPERQRGFIEALADTGSVRHAANAVNMTPEGAYHLRRHAEAGEFRKAWEAALALGVQRLEDVALERALNGVEVPVYSFGKIVGSRQVFNDRLLMFMLRNRSRKRFAVDGKVDAVGKAELAKLKKQWHAEWDAEINSPDNIKRVRDSIDARLESLREMALEHQEQEIARRVALITQAQAS